MEGWNNGKMGLWKNGVMEEWKNEAMEEWNVGGSQVDCIWIGIWGISVFNPPIPLFHHSNPIGVRGGWMSSDQGRAGAEEMRLHPNPDVISQQLENSMILLHLRTNRFYELNRTGARLWELLGSGLSRAEIKKQMMEEFDVDPVQFGGEMKELLELMKKEDLIVSR